MDYALFRLINGLAGRWAVLDTVIRLLMNDYLITTALALVLVVLWFSGRSYQVREEGQRAVLSAIVSMLLGNGIVKLMNLVFYRPRPFANQTVHLLFYRPTDSSFPSNAASVGFSMATAVWLLNRKMGAVMYALAAAMAVARICGGVHYPGDIVGGALVGTGAAWLVVKEFRFLGRVWTAIILGARRLLLA